MEWIADPGIWIGLATLVALEIVLGVDNLIFIAILAGRLPAEQRERARMIGLSLALVMRLALLASISWVMSLTTPVFTLCERGVSWRDLILIGGGLFLLVKATTEMHERLEVQLPDAGRSAGRRGVLAGGRADRRARHRVLARLGDHRGRHGRRALRDDGRGDHRGDRHVRRGEPAQRVHHCTPVADHPVSGLPADDRPRARGRRSSACMCPRATSTRRSASRC